VSAIPSESQPRVTSSHRCASCASAGGIQLDRFAVLLMPPRAGLSSTRLGALARARPSAERSSQRSRGARIGPADPPPISIPEAAGCVNVGQRAEGSFSSPGGEIVSSSRAGLAPAFPPRVRPCGRLTTSDPCVALSSSVRSGRRSRLRGRGRPRIRGSAHAAGSIARLKAELEQRISAVVSSPDMRRSPRLHRAWLHARSGRAGKVAALTSVQSCR